MILSDSFDKAQFIAAIDDALLPPRARTILRAIAEQADATGRASVAVHELAKWCGVSDKTVKRQLTDLMKRGHLVRIQRGGRDGATARPSTYQIGPIPRGHFGDSQGDISDSQGDILDSQHDTRPAEIPRGHGLRITNTSTDVLTQRDVLFQEKKSVEKGARKPLPLRDALAGVAVRPSLPEAQDVPLRGAQGGGWRNALEETRTLLAFFESYVLERENRERADKGWRLADRISDKRRDSWTNSAMHLLAKADLRAICETIEWVFVRHDGWLPFDVMNRVTGLYTETERKVTRLKKIADHYDEIRTWMHLDKSPRKPEPQPDSDPRANRPPSSGGWLTSFERRHLSAEQVRNIERFVRDLYDQRAIGRAS